MDYREVEGDSEYVARLTHGEDWRGQIESFAGELYVRSFDTELVREHDAVTDLDLWPL